MTSRRQFTRPLDKGCDYEQGATPGYVINPLTGREILASGKTARQLGFCPSIYETRSAWSARCLYDGSRTYDKQRECGVLYPQIGYYLNPAQKRKYARCCKLSKKY